MRCAVFRVVYLALVLWFAAGGGTFLPWSRVVATAQEPQQDDKKTTADKPAGGGVTQTPDAAVAPAKAANKPRKVITNDDIKSSPYAGFGGIFYTNTGSINDCDLSCFDQVHLFAVVRVYPDKKPNWRQEVLEQLEGVRSDSEWQAYLHELYDAHQKICQVTFDKTDELRRFGYRRNLGPQEIAVVEKYDAKEKAVEAELATVVARQATVQSRFSDKPYAKAFAMLQGMRMQGGFCSQARVIYPQ